jgi:hypothetical protein
VLVQEHVAKLAESFGCPASVASTAATTFDRQLESGERMILLRQEAE